MRTFSLFVSDTRYNVPSLALILAEDETRAIALATDVLTRSAFHTAVDLREGDKRVCRLEGVGPHSPPV